jgi:hypothetical protein
MHPIIRYVPVAVVQDNNIGGHQIDAEATGSCRQQKDQLVAAGLVIFVDARDTVVVCSPAIDMAIFWKDRS